MNGPSLIRVPDWIERPLGRYYLYFGHHIGEYIRLAYADNLHGPWQIYEPGVLPLVASRFAGKIASPDFISTMRAGHCGSIFMEETGHRAFPATPRPVPRCAVA
jgi:hypothetical protein